MHDPMVVAYDVPSPIPHRVKWRERGGKRWGFDVSRRTNPEHLGKRTYRWWRPKGYTLRLAGRAYGLGTLATIWHVEPGERDAFTVCKHASRWKWHIWHWKVQIPTLQGLRARLFDRCDLCGRKGRPNHSFSWADRSLGWRKWRSREGLYHSECASLHHLRRQAEEDKETMRELVAAFRVLADVDEEEAVNRLSDAFKGHGNWTDGWRRGRRLASVLGYDMRQSDCRYVHAEGKERTPEGMIR